jgi:hypothetical protein
MALLHLGVEVSRDWCHGDNHIMARQEDTMVQSRIAILVEFWIPALDTSSSTVGKVLNEHDVVGPVEVPRDGIAYEELSRQKEMHQEIDRRCGVLVYEGRGDCGVAQ